MLAGWHLRPTQWTGSWESLWEGEVGWSGPGVIFVAKVGIMSAACMTLKQQVRLVNSENACSQINVIMTQSPPVAGKCNNTVERPTWWKLCNNHSFTKNPLTSPSGICFPPGAVSLLKQRLLVHYALLPLLSPSKLFSDSVPLERIREVKSHWYIWLN